MKQVLVAVDQFANTVAGGWADETLSSRAHRRGLVSPGWAGAGATAAQVGEAATTRQAALTRSLDDAMSTLRSRYPEVERETWAHQAEEARARKAWDGSGDAPATPMLDRLAAADGITVDDMADAVLTKAAEFAAAAGDAVGRFRARRNEIDAIRTEFEAGTLTADEAVAEIDTVTWE